jgi:tripartite-type tricarboxylate transporter receptor subunit TctC
MLQKLVRGALVALLPTACLAQSYPSQPITLLVPWPPGGSVDITARIVGEPLGRALGGNVVVENRSGASGNIGMEAVARAKPDGHTLVINTVPLATAPSLYPKLGFDVRRDFAPVGTVVKSQHVLVVHPNVAAKNVPELVALAKSKPGRLNYASAGGGSTFHLAAELFKDATGTFMLHIPYRGGGPALLDTLSGQVELSFPVLSAALPHIKAGKLRVLGVTSTERSPLLPDTPTLREAGVKNYEFSGWLMILAPVATPRDVVAKINAAIGQVVRSPELSARFAREGFEPLLMSPEATATFLAAEVDRYTKLIRERGITAE